MIASDNLMTLETILKRPSRSKLKDFIVHRLKIISFTHKTISLDDLSKFYVEEDSRMVRLSLLKEAVSIDEIFYLATCNRIEFIFSSTQPCNNQFLELFFRKFNSNWTDEEIKQVTSETKVYEGDHALHHIFSVASSLDSMVVGEREIITQVRKAYDDCCAFGLTGDFLRLVMQSTLTTAKEVFTDTKIATHPISIVSIAYRKLRDLKVNLDARILIVGAGETNTNLSKYLVKHGFRNFSVFNRTHENGLKLAAALTKENTNRNAFPLSSLPEFSGGFDVMITCTGSADPVVTSEMYENLLQGDTSEKIVIDLGMPADVAKDVIEKNNIVQIDLQSLKTEASKNLEERKNELSTAESIIGESIVEFHQLLRLRKLEIALKEVPEKIREIKNRAMHDVFAKEIDQLDDHSKEVLGRVLDYVEKKCISVPMVMAKEIILDTH